ncbi:cAMP-regulated phosphoprotein 19 [Patella vulgata]|uniref:cAMP-regulated phosphoprotein 19 n=1 Tax=Patella caerulea TaxID=87958 RepID=A0AAN8JMF8_PATCE|nr:cAMP-regulated phosphoprotein 19 [Patella vulgata]
MATEAGSGTPPIEDDVFKQPQPKGVEQSEEARLRKKYPNLKGGGGTAILQKRLIQKGKYFDSGDYNMAKAKLNNPKKPLNQSEKLLIQESIGEAIPTPENLPARKPSLPSKLVDRLLIEGKQ